MQDIKQPIAEPIWTLSSEKTLTLLEASHQGLGEAEVRLRLECHGSNLLKEKPKRPGWMKFLDQFRDIPEILEWQWSYAHGRI